MSPLFILLLRVQQRSRLRRLLPPSPPRVETHLLRGERTTLRAALIILLSTPAGRSGRCGRRARRARRCLSRSWSHLATLLFLDLFLGLPLLSLRLTVWHTCVVFNNHTLRNCSSQFPMGPPVGSSGDLCRTGRDPLASRSRATSGRSARPHFVVRALYLTLEYPALPGTLCLVSSVRG